jgi:DUF4097 and DUF4098 domain-containing protein YvlB
MVRSLPILALLLVAVSFSCAADKRFDKTFDVSPGGTLRLDTDLGRVSVEGTGSSQVVIAVTIRGSSRDVEEFEVSAEKSGNDVEVIAGGKSRRWKFRDLDVRFVVKVPREYNLRVHTSGGDVEVQSVKGLVRGETSGGNVSVSDVEGKVHAETSGGNVRGRDIKGDVQMETSGGNVSVRSVQGSAEVETSGGNVEVLDVSGKVRAETSGGNVTVRVTGENAGIYAETSGGDIDITIGPEVKATLDASTSGGSVYCDFPVTVSGRIDPSRIRGQINGGGRTIHAHTSGGSIRIRPL